MSPARAAAINAVTDALTEALANGDAAVISLDRFGGAAEANDLTWASQQTAALLHYKQQMGAALITASLAIDNLVQVAATEGVTSEIVTADEIYAYQQQLATTGFSPQAIADYHAVGLSDDEIEQIRQEFLALNPAEAQFESIAGLRDWAEIYRTLGMNLLHPPVFAPVIASAAASRCDPKRLRQHHGPDLREPHDDPAGQSVDADGHHRRDARGAWTCPPTG